MFNSRFVVTLERCIKGWGGAVGVDIDRKREFKALSTIIPSIIP